MSKRIDRKLPKPYHHGDLRHALIEAGLQLQTVTLLLKILVERRIWGHNIFLAEGAGKTDGTSLFPLSHLKSNNEYSVRKQ